MRSIAAINTLVQLVITGFVVWAWVVSSNETRAFLFWGAWIAGMFYGGHLAFRYFSLKR